MTDDEETILKAMKDAKFALVCRIDVQMEGMPGVMSFQLRAATEAAGVEEMAIDHLVGEIRAHLMALVENRDQVATQIMAVKLNETAPPGRAN